MAKSSGVLSSPWYCAFANTSASRSNNSFANSAVQKSSLRLAHFIIILKDSPSFSLKIKNYSKYHLQSNLSGHAVRNRSTQCSAMGSYFFYVPQHLHPNPFRSTFRLPFCVLMWCSISVWFKQFMARTEKYLRSQLCGVVWGHLNPFDSPENICQYDYWACFVFYGWVFF